MSIADRRRSLARLGRPRLRIPRPSPRLLAALVVLVGVLIGVFLWVRQSSLVAVRHVTITGVSGPDAAQIRTALTGAALGTSTLALDATRLHAAVAPYPVVRSVRLHSHFPHGLTIAVSEQVPVAVVVADGSRITVAADGTLLHGVTPSAGLPEVAVPVVPGGTHVAGPAGVAVSLLAAAPYRLLARVQSAGDATALGLVATLRSGPQIVFGADSDLAAKWRAAVAVLASATSQGASYIDVTDPARPAAGSGSDTESSGSPNATGAGAAPSGATGSSGTATGSASANPSDTSTISTSSTG